MLKPQNKRQVKDMSAHSAVPVTMNRRQNFFLSPVDGSKGLASLAVETATKANWGRQRSAKVKTDS